MGNLNSVAENLDTCGILDGLTPDERVKFELYMSHLIVTIADNPQLLQVMQSMYTLGNQVTFDAEQTNEYIDNVRNLDTENAESIRDYFENNNPAFQQLNITPEEVLGEYGLTGFHIDVPENLDKNEMQTISMKIFRNYQNLLAQYRN